MKKIYSLFVLLLGLFSFGTLSASAQDEVTIAVNKTTGDWTSANANKTWAKTWESTSENPHLVIHEANGANNMNYYDGTNIKFYNSLGGNTTQENYNVTCTEGWYVAAISFDFFCDNTQGVGVSICGGEIVENFETSATGAVHIEATDLPEDEMAYFTVATLGTATTFANTLNFVVTLKKQDPLTAAWAAFTDLFNRYSAYTEEEFPVGTEPGQYGEEAVAAFFKAVSDAAAIDEMDRDEVTIEQLQAIGKAMEDAYAAMLASKVVFEVTNGYYRFRTGLNYNDGNVKYLMSYTLDQTTNAYWGTPADAEDNLATVWKITKSGNDYDIVSVMSNGRFATVPTSGAATLTTDAGTLMAIETAANDGVNTYVNIRLTTSASGGANYVHQNGHGGGAGTGNNIVGWYTTYNGTPGGSEWVLEPVDEGEVQSLQAAFAEWKQHTDLVSSYNTLFNTAATEIAKSQDDAEGTALISSADQLSSPFSDSEEGLDLGALLDNDASTYWHSDWHNGAVAPHSHYLQIELVEPVTDLVRMSVLRRPVSGNHITRWAVYGSNDPDADDVSWTMLTELFTPYGTNTETVHGLAFDSKQFKFLRFWFDANTGGSGIGHMSEFQLHAISTLEGTTYGAAGTAATNLQSVLLAQYEIASADLTQEHYNTLKAAYDAFHAKYADPTEMRQLIQQAEELAAGVISGSNPGQWSDASAADALKSTIAAAKAYDEAGNYEAAALVNYVNTMTQQMEAIQAAANPIKTDTWYRIRFATEDEFAEGGWDTVAGDATDSDDALWGKYVTVAKYVDGAHDDIDPTDVRIGTRLYFFDDANIDDADKSLFRFVDAGEKGCLLQNKATGLFLKAAGTSGGVTLDIVPSYFKVSAIGYGQNLIAASSLTGAAQNYLHAQVSQNTLVTWNATAIGSRSGLYIEEAGDAAGFDEMEFFMDIQPGRFYSFCYPANLAATEGKLLKVSGVEGNVVNLTSATEAAAGEPFFYLYEDVESYAADGGTDAIPFRHGYDFVTEPQNTGALVGSFTANTDLGKGKIVANGNKLEVTDFMGHIAANEAYINPATALSTAEVITVVIDGEKVIDGVHDLGATLKSVYTTGDIFTLDGRRVGRGNIDSLTGLPRGIYVINGTKVAVK